jgi:hypothetical protein
MLGGKAFGQAQSFSLVKPFGQAAMLGGKAFGQALLAS